MPPWAFFAHRTIERSGPPASPSCISPTRKSVSILERLDISLSPQSAEGGRHDVPSTRPPFPAIESATSSKRRPCHANAEYQIPIITLNPSSPPSSRKNMLGPTFVDVLAFCGSEYDTFAEGKISGVITSMGNHEGEDINNISSNYHTIDYNALVFTVPPLTSSPLSPPTMSSTSISIHILKHFCTIFGLAPIQKDRFVHAVATDPSNGQIQTQLDYLHPSSPTHYNFPLQAVMLRELDKFAKLNRIHDLPPPIEKVLWELGTPASCPHELEGHFIQRPDKGKGRMIEPCDVDSKEKPQLTSGSRSAGPSTSTIRKPRRYVYDPNLKNIPLFLVGSSTSLFVYAAEGYHSPPRKSRRRSVRDSSPLHQVFSLSGVAPFKFFKRPCSDLMSVSQTGALEKNKKTFGWLKI